MEPLNLPFDQYQRYKAVQEAIDILRDKRPMKVLDVGCGEGRIFDFLPNDKVYVLDREAYGPKDSFICADAVRMPFGDRSFDVTVSVDTIEHIRPELREEFLKELWRVSKRYIILAAPLYAPGTEEAERILFEFTKGVLGIEHHFLKDHIEFGLPKGEELVSSIKDMGGRVAVIPNGYLSRWLPMMMVSFYINQHPGLKTLAEGINRFYNENYYREDNREPCYRHIIVASRRPFRRKALTEIEKLRSNTKRSTDMDLSWAYLLISILSHSDIRKKREADIKNILKALESKDIAAKGFQRHAKNLEALLKAKEENLKGISDHANNLERLLEAKEEHIRKLSAHIEGLKKIIEDKTAHSKTLSEIIKKKEENTASVIKHAKNLEALIAAKEENLKGLSAHAKNLERLLKNKDENLKGLSLHAANLEKLLKAKEENLKGLAAHAKNLEKLLGEKEKNIKGISAHAKNLERLLENKDKLLDQSSAHVKDLEKLLVQKEEELNTLSLQKEGLEKLLSEKEKTNEELSSGAKKLQRLLEEKERALKELSESLEEKTGLIEEQRKEISRLGGIVDAGEKNLKNLEGRLKTLEAAVKEAEEKVRERDEDIERLKGTINELEDRLKSIEGTLLYRVLSGIGLTKRE